MKFCIVVRQNTIVSIVVAIIVFQSNNISKNEQNDCHITIIFSVRFLTIIFLYQLPTIWMIIHNTMHYQVDWTTTLVLQFAIQVIFAIFLFPSNMSLHGNILQFLLDIFAKQCKKNLQKITCSANCSKNFISVDIISTKKSYITCVSVGLKYYFLCVILGKVINENCWVEYLKVHM